MYNHKIAKLVKKKNDLQTQGHKKENLNCNDLSSVKDDYISFLCFATYI
jgi:hypothetical protein